MDSEYRQPHDLASMTVLEVGKASLTHECTLIDDDAGRQIGERAFSVGHPQDYLGRHQAE